MKNSNIFSPWSTVFSNSHPRLIKYCALLGLWRRPLAEIRYIFGRLVENGAIDSISDGPAGKICKKCNYCKLCHELHGEYEKSIAESQKAYYRIRSAVNKKRKSNE